MSKILIGGLDGSLRNFGVARMELDIATDELSVTGLYLPQTDVEKNKQVRASSATYFRAKYLHDEVTAALEGASVVFAEIPYGGKSYDAVLGFGIVIGIYGSLSIPLIEVSQSETKKAAVGTRTASKEEMIAWAFELYPNAPWLTTKRGGVLVPTKANEHLADACAVVHAGIKTPAFRQVKAILAAGSKLAA
ncbi:hypothetical protein NKH72_21990 [Mesorhizobium sp. M0955]|uniref:hypothetical protein n=1 Tax=Mesorhizobium sp. M0955 TaxID=2957033 RepID=UPI00333A8826